MKRALPLALAAAAVCACWPAKDTEPNDDPSQATAARPGAIEGTLRDAKDVDVFKVDVKQESAVLSARVGGIRGADFTLSILDGSRQELKRVDDTALGGDEELLDIGVSRGPYYVVLASKPEAAPEAGQTYSLQLKVQQGPGREREPDDSPQTASPLDVPGVTRGHYAPARNLLAGDTDYAEQDWLSLEVQQPGLFLMNLDVSDVPKVDPVVEVYDANFYKVKDVDSAGVGEGESLKSFGVRGPAKFLVRLRPKTPAANAETPWEILTELVPYHGRSEFEPNDQRPDATPLERDSIAGGIAPAGDADWYKVSVQQEQKFVLRAAVSGVEGMDVVLEARDSLGTPLVSIDGMGKSQPEVLTGLGVTKGDVYLVVSEKTGRRADARQGYTLNWSLTPHEPGLEYEVNDSTASPQAVKVGESVDGYLAPRGDADVYEFNVYQAQTVAFELAGVLNVQFAASLMNQDLEEVGAWKAAKAGDALVFDKALEPGTYWLRLRAAAPDQENVRDKYSLRLKAR